MKHSKKLKSDWDFSNNRKTNFMSKGYSREYCWGQYVKEVLHNSKINMSFEEYLYPIINAEKP